MDLLPNDVKKIIHRYVIVPQQTSVLLELKGVVRFIQLQLDNNTGMSPTHYHHYKKNDKWYIGYAIYQNRDWELC